jgi:hypothetical protein
MSNIKNTVETENVLIASTEDDKEHFRLEYEKITGIWKSIESEEGSDFTISKNGDYYLINDCGVRSLYKLKYPEFYICVYKQLYDIKTKKSGNQIIDEHQKELKAKDNLIAQALIGGFLTGIIVSIIINLIY